MDYIGLCRVGIAAYKSLSKSHKVLSVLKDVAKPVMIFVLSSLVSDAIDKGLEYAISNYIPKETE